MQTGILNTMATDRITKQVIKYIDDMHRKAKQMNYVKELKKSVEHGKNGTQKYVIKEGENKGKVV